MTIENKIYNYTYVIYPSVLFFENIVDWLKTTRTQYLTHKNTFLGQFNGSWHQYMCEVI